ncbi:MAG: FecR domain-containing protein [Chryseolinea sp.]
MSKIEINDDLIARFLTGDALPEEAIAITDWLKDAQNRHHFELLESTWRQSAGVSLPKFDKASAWKKVSDGSKIAATVSAPVRSRSLWPFGIAAAVVALALSAYFVFFLRSPLPELEMGNVSTSDSFRFIELPDRSTVTLHRNSQLQYPDQFTGAYRQVRLERGRAYFNVTHDAGNPFVVEAGEVKIKVLGTEFNVQLDEAQMTVHVREGRVLLTSAVDSVTITSGMTAGVRYGRFSVTDVPVGNLYSYATQRLVFDDAPLSDVIRDLEDSYPYTFELKNTALENCRLTATFYKDDIDKIVNLVAETLNLTVAKNGRHFTIGGEGCL